ncbi:MAG: radical SAM protein [Elusimicrobia bacterium]|nr:radical SAM protein [Elusimicrobiota bacterium]
MKKIELVLWFRCNCRCRFCVVDAATARQSMSTEDAVRHLKLSRGQGAEAVDFGGGEPTLRPDLPKLAAAALRLGYACVGVKSNGLRLCYPEYVSELLAAGIRRFAVPVWGHVPSVHDSFSQVPGSFEMMEMGLKHVLDLGGAAEADVLLTNATVPHLTDLVGHFADIGVRSFQFWLYSLFGSAGRLAEELPTLTAAGAAVRRTAAAFSKRGLALSTTHLPPCFLGREHGLYRSIASEDLAIITPGGSFPAQESPFEAGVKTSRCRGCASYGSCAGARPEYLERFGPAEISARRRAKR